MLDSGKVAARSVSAMLNDGEQGFKPVAAFSDSEDDTPDTEEDMPISAPCWERQDNAQAFARNFGINTAVIAPEGVSRTELDELADWRQYQFQTGR